jgi:hypothetical protein
MFAVDVNVNEIHDFPSDEIKATRRAVDRMVQQGQKSGDVVFCFSVCLADGIKTSTCIDLLFPSLNTGATSARW